jgi:hypothetical protein
VLAFGVQYKCVMTLLEEEEEEEEEESCQEEVYGR